MVAIDPRAASAAPLYAAVAAALRMTGLRFPHRGLATLAAGFLALGCGSDPAGPNDSPLTLSTTAHDFGAMGVGGRSPVLVLTVSNSGTTTTGALAAALSGPASDDFAILKDECTGVRLSGGSTCVIEIEVIPSALGLRQAVITVTGSSGERVTAALTGTGSSSGLSLSPTVVAFGETAIGQEGLPKTIVVRNTAVTATGAITVAISGADGASFRITQDSCSMVSLTPSASCAIDVRFLAPAEGSYAATLSVTGASAPSRSSQLTGLARAPTTLSASPGGGYTFAAQSVGSSGAAATFAITNTGTRSTGALGLSVSGANPSDFHVAADGCYPTLPAGGICTVVVNFFPSGAGMRTAAVSVSDPFGSNVTITVAGEGIPAAPAPTPLTMTPGGIFSFPPTLVSSAISQTVTVTNPGPVATSALSTSVLICDYYYYGCYPSSGFSLENDTCAGVSLPAGGSCTVSVSFRPTYIGTEMAQFDVYAPGFSGSLVVSGTGTGLHTSVGAVNFAPTAVGATSQPQTIFITNTGTAPTGTIATEISGFVFEISSNTCSGVALPPGASCAIAVRFKPTSPGGRYGSLGITATPGGSVQIQLFGAGL